MAIRFRPSGGIFLDPIPIYYNSEYHIYYLKGNSEESGWPRGQTPWGHIKSKDIFNWEEMPDAIRPGVRSEPDGYGCFTGSILIEEGIWHMFYTGENPGFEQGRENILHAVSHDGISFHKDINKPLVFMDERFYGKGDDWRDPFVFWNHDENCYCMTITTCSVNSVCSVKRGVIGLAKSVDLLNWKVSGPIYEPNSFSTLECSDIFKIGKYWYMIFSQSNCTEYRISNSLYGPWYRPKNPVFDAGEFFFYAAKTLFDGDKRYIFGWCGTLDGDTDNKSGQWGGDMVTPRELVQLGNGELAVKCPEIIISEYNKEEFCYHPVLGNWVIDNKSISTYSNYGFSAGICRDFSEGIIKLDIVCPSKEGKAGILINSAPDLSNYYAISIDFGLRCIAITRCKSKSSKFGDYMDGIKIISSDILPELTDRISLIILFKNDIIEVFINQKSAMTCRISDIKGGEIGFFADHSSVEFNNIFIGKIHAY